MEIQFDHKPAYSLAKVSLGDGESIRAESGAMVYMTPNMQMETSMQSGGVMGALKKSVLGGESLFVNTFTAQGGQGEIGLAPSAPGDVELVELQGETWFLEGSAYLASSPTINVDTKFQGMKGLLSREGLFFIKASGSGQLIINCFGGLSKHQVNGEFVVDTGNLVAYSEGLTYEVERVGGLKASLLSGEGLISRLRGQGTVMVQSRSPGAFASWIKKFIPSK